MTLQILIFLQTKEGVFLLTSEKQDDKLACLLLQVRFCCWVCSEIFDFRVWETSKLQIVHWVPISGFFWNCCCVGRSERVSRHMSGYCDANRAVSTHPFTSRAITWVLYLILVPKMLQLRILERVTKGPTIRRTQSQSRCLLWVLWEIWFQISLQVSPVYCWNISSTKS